MTSPLDVHLYEFTVTDPRERYATTWCGYIGESERIPHERMGEHLAKVPWGDTVVSWRIIETGHPGKSSAWSAEKAAIEAKLPLYNTEYNRANPYRIDYDMQVRQRHERDRAAGRPLWQPKAPRRARTTPSTPRPPARPRLTRAQKRARVRLAGYALTWAVLAAAAWWGLPQLGLPSGAGVSSGAASAALAGGRGVWWFAGLSRRRRKQVVALLFAVAVGGVTVWAATRR